MLRNRWFRVAATVVVTGARRAYIVSKIDVGKTAHIIGTADPWWLASVGGADVRHRAAPGLALAAAARGARDPRALALADARLLRLVRRRPGAADRRSAATRRGSTRRPGAIPGYGSPIAGSVLLERAIGGAVTLVARRRSASCSRSAATTSAPTSGSRRSSSSLTMIAGVVVFSRAPAAPAAFAVPLCARLRVERPVARGLRGHPRLPLPRPDAARRRRCDASSLQLVADRRDLGLGRGRRDRPLDPARTSCSARCSSSSCSSRSRSTGSACARRSSSASSGKLGVDADPAFATGFLFFLLTLAARAAGARGDPLGGDTAG